MKRRDLLRRLRLLAENQGVELRLVEGGRHTKIFMGDRQSVEPRHLEINEITARKIIQHFEGAR